MNPIRRDLLERKLWLVVAVLVLAIAAVPFVLRKSGGAGVSIAPAPAAAATDTSTVRATRPANVHALLVSIPRDPFASGMPKLSSKPESATKSSTASASSTATSASSSSASSGSSPASMVSPAPTSASPDAGSGSSSDTSGAPTGGDTGSGETSTVTTTTTVTVPAPSNQWASSASLPSWTVFSVALRFGQDGNAPVHSDVARLTPLPSVAQPRVMFMGVVAGGQEAVFALGNGVEHSGPGLCRPNRARCAAIMLRAGQTEQISVPSATGVPQTFQLSLVSIASHVTHERKDALSAFDRHSTAGLCELDLANPVSYSQTDGTIASVASWAACKGVKHAVPFPG